jgi:NAD(P)-dependent dehydrogenase (short-subunit alcohol dehydrogenase family)
VVAVDFAGDVVLVTGGGAGLGRSYALELSRRGARVVVNDLGTAPDGRQGNGGSAEQVVDEIRRAGGAAIGDGHSVADAEGAKASVDTALNHYGRLDAVINNAGIVRFGNFGRLSEEDVDAVLGVHFRGSLLVSQAAWAVMAAQGYGRIILTTSSIGLLGSPGQAAYAAAKGALVGLTRLLAAEGPSLGIRVNAVAPMAVTRLNEEVMRSIFGDMASQLSPDRVAPVVAFLAHRDCELNGEILSAAGGRVARFALGSGPPVAGLESPEAIGAAIEAIRATVPSRWWTDPDRAGIG